MMSFFKNPFTRHGNGDYGDVSDVEDVDVSDVEDTQDVEGENPMSEDLYAGLEDLGYVELSAELKAVMEEGQLVANVRSGGSVEIRGSAQADALVLFTGDAQSGQLYDGTVRPGTVLSLEEAEDYGNGLVALPINLKDAVQITKVIKTRAAELEAEEEALPPALVECSEDDCCEAVE